jgi:hypothetical protein
MPENIIRSFAEKSGKSEEEVERLWRKAKSLVTLQYDIEEPGDDTGETEKERYYKLATGILKHMVGLGKPDESCIDTETAALLEGFGMQDVLSMAIGAGIHKMFSHLTCKARSCKYNRRGRCRLKPTDIVIDLNHECKNYKR